MPKTAVVANDLSSQYFDFDAMEWADTDFPGVQIKLALNDEASGLTTMLVKMAPGAKIPDHIHQGIEQSFILEGSLDDHEGSCGPGQFVWRPAGSRHEAVAPNGAVLLSVFTAPNKFMDGTPFFTD